MKALIIGLGGIGQRHLRNLVSLYPDIEIAAYRVRNRTFEIKDDLTVDYNVNIQEKYRIKCLNSLEGVDKFQPDFAIVANPTSLHAGTTIKLLHAGIPIFVEKPIATNLADAQCVADLAEEQSIPVVVGFMMRHHPHTAQIKHILEQNNLGRLSSAQLTVHSYFPSWHSYEQCNQFYAGLEELGGGVVLTECHEMDLLHYFFSAPKRLSAFAGKTSSLPIDVEDTAGVLLEFCHQGHCFPITVNLSFMQRSRRRCLSIYGEEGSLEWDLYNSRLVVYNSNGEISASYDDLGVTRNDLFINELKDFINHIDSGKKSVSPIADVLQTQETLSRIRETIST